MKITIDRDAGAAYIQFEPLPVGETVSTDTNSSSILPDYNKEGKLFGIEILELSKLNIDSLKTVEFIDITTSPSDEITTGEK